MRSYASLEIVIATLRQGLAVAVYDPGVEKETDIIVAAEAARSVNSGLRSLMRAGGKYVVAVGPGIAQQFNLVSHIVVQDEPNERTCRFAGQIEPLKVPDAGVSLRDHQSLFEILTDPSSDSSALKQNSDGELYGHTDVAIAVPGGILERPGHTEAVIALCQLAELAPAGAMREVTSEFTNAMADPDEVATRFWDLPLTDIPTIQRWVEESKG